MMEKRKVWKMRVSSALLSLVLLMGIVAGAPLHALAASPPVPLLLGEGDTLDFDNPPPVPEGYTPPQVGLGEVLLPAEVLGQEEDSLEADLLKLLLQSTFSWAVESGLDFGKDSVLSAMFGDKQQEQMNQVLANQKIMIDLIERLTTLVTTLNYKTVIDAKTAKTNTLWDKYLNKSTAIADKNITKQQRKDKLKEYFNGTGDNYVMQVMDLYVNYIEGRGMLNGNIFSTYDAYSLYNFWWEHQGYDFRESVRVLEAAKYIQMWSLAYAACEAHVQDKTTSASEAQAAQGRLMEMLKGDKNSLLGLEGLLKKWEVKRLSKYNYNFQVPGHEQKYYIPPQQDVFDRINIIRDIKKVGGMQTQAALRRYCQQIPDAANPNLLHTVTSPEKTLAPLEQYYRNNGSQQSIYQILGNLTGDTLWSSPPKGSKWKKEKIGIMTDREFRYYLASFFSSVYEYVSEPDFTGNTIFHPTEINLRTTGFLQPRSSIRETLVSKPLCWYAVFNQETMPTNSNDADEIPAELEASDVGVVADVGESSIFLQVQIPGEDHRPPEEVLVTPETQMANGVPLDEQGMQSLLNAQVRIDGIYNVAENIVTAKTITVMDDIGLHEVSGFVVSSVENAVMIQDESGTIDGYFLPNVEGDIPQGTKITLHYHWEDGKKKVDDYELTNPPDTTPVSGSDVAPPSSEETAPASGSDVAPPSSGETAPASGSGVAPPSSGETAPVSGAA